jgi:O-antigen/teichoic acid export membrane protein
VALGRNLLAGLASSLGTTLIGLAAVPLYLRYLGIEAYGIIGFFATLQAVLQVLDLGLGPTLNREVARFGAAGDLGAARRLLHTLAAISWAVALSIGVLVAAASPLLAAGWLRAEQVSAPSVARSVALMGLVIASRWPVSIYAAALMGAERIALVSGLSLAASAAANLGAVAILALASPTLEAFFLWQALAGAAHVAVLRLAAWRLLGGRAEVVFDRGELRRVWRFSAGMTGVAAYAAAFSQVDKVILSSTLPLREFAGYALASVVAGAMYLPVTPLYNAVFPRFSALVMSGEEAALAQLYRRGTRRLGSFTFPLAMWLALCGTDLVALWTGDAALARDVGPVLTLLAAGSALHGVMFLPYALQLAHGRTRLPLLVATILFAALVPLVLVLSLRMGARGGALAWLIVHVLYVPLGAWLTHRVLLPGLGPAWLLREVGAPLAIAVAAGLLGCRLLPGVGWGPWPRLAAGAVLAVAATGASLLGASGLRATARDLLGRRPPGG